MDLELVMERGIILNNRAESQAVYSLVLGTFI